MTHLEYLQTLSMSERFVLIARDDKQAGQRVAVLLLCLLLCSIAIIGQWPMTLLWLWLQGILLSFSYCLLHESSHLTAFNNRRYDRLASWVCGVISGIGPQWFRHYHFAHHHYTRDPQRDPELFQPRPQTKAQWLWQLSGLPFFGQNLMVLIRSASGQNDTRFIKAADVYAVANEARAILLIYVLLALLSIGFSSTLILTLYLIPMLLGQPFLRMFLTAEHGLCAHNSDVFENTRTVQSNALIRYISWNMTYHVEHHLIPSVPFHRLETVHQQVQGHIQHLTPSYMSFLREYWHSLR